MAESPSTRDRFIFIQCIHIWGFSCFSDSELETGQSDRTIATNDKSPITNDVKDKMGQPVCQFQSHQILKFTFLLMPKTKSPNTHYRLITNVKCHMGLTCNIIFSTCWKFAYTSEKNHPHFFMLCGRPEEMGIFSSSKFLTKANKTRSGVILRRG